MEASAEQARLYRSRDAWVATGAGDNLCDTRPLPVFAMIQRVRYVRSADHLNIAWAEAGRGTPLVKAANWLTHLEADWESPVWRHWTRFFAGNFRYIRHDERGCGMSDRDVGELSFALWVQDLERVVDAAGIEQPFVLLGISQGAAVAAAYAALHPQRVSHLILYGGYATGIYGRGDAEAIATFRAVTELMRHGWDSSNPVFRQLFTSRFIPDGNSEQIGWFNELCASTTSAATGAALMAARGHVDARDALPQVRAPTLVLHALGDQVVPLAQGRILAQEIPGASFVQLDSRNHVLLEHEPAWRQFQSAVLEFTGKTVAPFDAGAAQDPRLQSLTRRERELLAQLRAGSSNAQIAGTLGIAEKTVRNHLSHLYEKLGVHSRAAAIVLSYAQDGTSSLQR
jgi:pimeloyl-ACP methyl ester carboxylesterase/DNA-binding CsgD family transcriptional regulator